MGIILMVIDGLGIGSLPDAKEFGDERSNTYVNVVKKTGLSLSVLEGLGLNAIDGVNLDSCYDIFGNYGRIIEKTKAKDTTAGHYEMAGIVLDKPYPTFPNGFPEEFVKGLEKYCGVEFLGNEVASGTEIIQRLGLLHQQTLKPILYTSQDSVLQIAADENLFGLEKLYDVCKKAREYCTGEFNVARIIARPFVKGEDKFIRTQNRHDYALLPPKESMLDKLSKHSYDVVSIGKIKDIFCGQGITKALPGKNNQESLKSLKTIIASGFNGLVFANLVDTDMLYGHRNDVEGYANALKKINQELIDIIEDMRKDDILIITGDHGCDPTTKSTDHSREYVPILVYGKKLKQGVNLGTLEGFDVISKSILDYFKIEKYDNSIFKVLQVD